MFFGLALLPESFRDLLEFAAIVMVFLLLLIYRIYYSETPYKQYFKTEVYLFLLSVFFSMFIAYYYHGQDFKTTLVVQRFMYFYTFYFLLHEIGMKFEVLEKIIIVLAGAYLLFFMVQYVIFPTILFDVRIDVDRGTLRIFLPGSAFLMYAYFKFLQLFLSKQKLKYAIYVFVIFIVGVVLPGTRQILASITFLTMIFILFNKQVRSRFFIIILSVIAGISIFFILYDMFMELILLTQMETSSSDETNVRVLAMIFFLNEFMPADIAYIFGNGQDSLNSGFGKQVHFYKLFYGFFQSDIGIIGDYTKFGVLFVIAQVSIFLKVFFWKLHPDLDFLKYLFFSFFLTWFSGRNMFGNSSGIVFMMLILYMVDYYKTKCDTKVH